MRIANLKEALDCADQDYKDTRKIKGYALYGILSTFTLSHVQIAEKVRGGGVFALFYPKVIEHIKDQPYYEGLPDNMMPTGGSMLIYVEDERYLGKNVEVRLTKKTSLQRFVRGDNDSTCILSWERRPHSDIWEIIPTKVKLIGETCGSLSGYIEKGYLNGKQQMLFTKIEGCDNEVFWQNQGEELVSSAPMRLPITKRRIQYTQPYKDNSYSFEPESELLNAYRHDLAILETHKTRATQIQGKAISEILAKCRKRRKQTETLTISIIRGFLGYCLEHWEQDGKGVLTDFMYQLIDVTTVDQYDYNLHAIIKVLDEYMPFMAEDCERLFFKRKITANKESLAVYMIAYVAGIPFQRVSDCLHRILDNDGPLRPIDCLYLILSDPFSLQMFGAGFRYEDCIALRATLKLTKSNCEQSKEMLYTLNVYKEYTKRSRYRDTLITEEEWVKAEESKRVSEICAKQNAERYFHTVSHLTAGEGELFVPKRLTAPKNIQDYSPITVANIPRMDYYKPIMSEILQDLVAKGLIIQLNHTFIPTYEARMELGIAKRLLDNTDRYKLIMSDDFGKLIDYVDSVADTDTIYVGDTYIANDKMKYCHRPPYIEPIYYCKLYRDKPFDETYPPKQYIISDISDYSLWEFATLMDTIRDMDSVIFMSDKGQKPPEKGVTILPFLSKVIKTVQIGVAEEDYLNHEIIYGKSVLSNISETLYFPSMSKEIRTYDDEELLGYFESQLKQKDREYWESAQVIATNDELSTRINDTIVQGLNINSRPLFYIEGKPYYVGTKITYQGRTTTTHPRYERTKVQGKVYYKKVGTVGLSRRHTVNVMGIFRPKDLRYEGKPTKMPYTEDEAVVVVGFTDSQLKQDVFLFLRGFYDSKTKELYGQVAREIEYGYSQSIYKQARVREDTIILAQAKDDIVCREDLTDVYARAKKNVVLVGDVGVQKSGFGYSMETVYPEQRRVLFSRIVRKGLEKNGKEKEEGTK